MNGAVAAPDLRLAIPALGLWIATGIGVGLPDAGPLAVVLGAIAMVAVAAAALAHRRSRGRVAALCAVVAVGAALAATGCCAVAVREPVRRPGPLVAAAAAHRSVTLDIRTEADPVDGRVRGTAERIRSSAGEAVVSSPVLVFGEGIGRIPVGSLVRVDGVLRSGDPGDDVAFLAFARAPPELIGTPGPLLEALGRLRSGFASAARHLPPPGGGLLPGLAIGDTSAVSESLAADMRTASLTHLTAVSGANCAVIVGLTLVVLTALGAPRLVRLAGSAAMLGLFVALVLPQPSVIRAAAMALLVLAATAIGRPVRGVPLLAAAVTVILLVDPWLSRDYGFALSVLATGGLLVLAPMLAARLARVLPRPLALAIAVPTAAQLACQPVLLMLTSTVPLWGIPANLLAEPAAPLATVLGLVAVVVLPLAPPLGRAIAWLAWLPSSWIAGVAKLSAALPGAGAPWLPGLVGTVAMAALIALALVAAVGRGRPRVLAGLGVLAVVALWGGCVAGGAVAAARGRPADWQYAECDIGQGDASVIRSAGVTALVDTGPEPARLRSCLRDLGVSRIQLLVLTHYDLDHVGGTDAVLGMVDRALIGPSSGADDDRVATRLRAAGAAVEQASTGLSGTLGRLDWHVLWPPTRGVEPGNPASVTLSVTPASGCSRGCLSALLLGDLGRESQTRLLGTHALGTYDVVKVAHHGSADQAPELYQRIRAPVGLIGVGADNDYGHPTAFCLGMLADAGTQAFRTDRQGLVLVEDAGRGAARVWTERAVAGTTGAAGAVHPAFTPRAYGPEVRVPRAEIPVEGGAAWNPSSSSSWWWSSLSRSTSPTASTTPRTRWPPRSPPEHSGRASRSRSPPC